MRLEEHFESSSTLQRNERVARMAWVMMAKGERYREPVALAA
jgi:hypothetical protein